MTRQEKAEQIINLALGQAGTAESLEREQFLNPIERSLLTEIRYIVLQFKIKKINQEQSIDLKDKAVLNYYDLLDLLEYGSKALDISGVLSENQLTLDWEERKESWTKRLVENYTEYIKRENAKEVKNV